MALTIYDSGFARIFVMHRFFLLEKNCFRSIKNAAKSIIFEPLNLNT